MNKIELGYKFKGVECVRLQTGRYMCVIAPKMGCSVLRLRDEKNGVEVFRYREDCTADRINEAREIWGLPTLYLPNRFDNGVLRTSDELYRLPINETLFGNYIHGWVHKREHEVECYSTEDGKCVLVTSYTFDKNDEMYEYFLSLCRERFSNVECGIFGADMKVALTNDGPFTIILDSNEIM